MVVQLSLIQDKPKELLFVPVAQLSLSEFNPRSTRPDEDIDKLAARISRNGFEITRALWAYRNGSGYKVFAGGTRLEAAKRAALNEVPIVLYDELTDEEIVKLAYDDNENDEYHAPVSVVDVWANYAALAAQGWTQQRIAEAVGVTRVMVSYRLSLNSLPEKIKDFVSQGQLTEAHLTEIMQLSVDLHFDKWITTTTAQFELARKAVHDKSKNGSKTVKAVKADVDLWKEFINYAETVYQKLSESVTLYSFETNPPQPYQFNAKEKFVAELFENGARSLVKVKVAEQAVKDIIADNLDQYQVFINSQSLEAARQAQKSRLEAEILGKFVNADCLQVIEDWQLDKINLLFIDPPYGKDFQSNRRWASNAPKKIKGDGEQEAMVLLENALSKAIPLMADDSHSLIFCDWEREPEVRDIVKRSGLKIKGSLIWVKEEHSAGDIKGAFGPSHERIIHAVKGSPVVTPRIRDVLQVTRSNETTHPTEKPIALLEPLILSTTNENHLVVDLFAGCASTLLAAMKNKRDFFGIEIDNDFHEEGSARLLKGFENGK